MLKAHESCARPTSALRRNRKHEDPHQPSSLKDHYCDRRGKCLSCRKITPVYVNRESLPICENCAVNVLPAAIARALVVLDHDGDAFERLALAFEQAKQFYFQESGHLFRLARNGGDYGETDIDEAGEFIPYYESEADERAMSPRNTLQPA